MNLEIQFVDQIPEDVEGGVLYVSIPFATAVHECCCGCGNEVVTPLSPTDWELRFDGESVSLYPSIGNWGFPCQSHYWIVRNRVIWGFRWNPWEIADARAEDKEAKARYYAHKNRTRESTSAAEEGDELSSKGGKGNE